MGAPKLRGSCKCRICEYSARFEDHLARVPEADRPFWEDLFSRWEHTDFDLQWERTRADREEG